MEREPRRAARHRLRRDRLFRAARQGIQDTAARRLPAAARTVAEPQDHPLRPAGRGVLDRWLRRRSGWHGRELARRSPGAAERGRGAVDVDNVAEATGVRRAVRLRWRGRSKGRRKGPGHRQSGAAGDRRRAAACAALFTPVRPAACARHRRQPWRAGAERNRAAGAGTYRGRKPATCRPPVRRQASRGSASGLSDGGGGGGNRAVHRRHGRALRRGRRGALRARARSR